ncbi:CHAT domain-containing protein [Streptomyces sp. TG1A-8]|uniref:CHAT domain-containing protein n=1 Tax=Streptomyces sp. TG1A-8 TaxID=3051385 RepID=UPI00265BE84F|nr:CHAT domain-containing protein [Streptomyces sp. TG1A-8]MDO0928907.1 CHAT domain-containing protein [Streptomyces sp. TG1A-8]
MDDRGEPVPADGRMVLARRLAGLLEEVRRLPGLGGFQRPLPATDLRRAAALGPVVTVNVTQRRTDALIVTPDEVSPIPLGFTAGDVRETAYAYVEAVERHQSRLAALEEADAAAQETFNARTCTAYQQAAVALVEAEAVMESALTSTLEWLWEAIGRPVLDACGFREPPGEGRPWPRLWWCPTGLLTLLPLHAAGRHGEAGQSSLDRAVMSYTPSLRVLIESRSWERSTVPGGMLHVALPETPGQRDLPHVEREEELLTALFGADCTTLKGPAADRTSVRRGLAVHRSVHFSCHATSHPLRPASGGALLSDGLLTTGEIAANHRHRDFAFLSACKTALGGLLVPDESMTLSAALHYTGYRHVIGTLWSVRDAVAAEVAEDVYRDLWQDGVFRPDRAAAALHGAVRRLRDASPHEPSHWMSFTHTGP